MSQYTAIRAVSESLQQMLEQYITDPGVSIELKTPREMHADLNTGISVWMYRITRNEHVLNHPAERIGVNQVRRQPLPVNLHYLVTPMMSDPLDEQELLGRVLQVFNDHPVLSGADLAGALAGSLSEFRISLETPTLEELTRVWEALQESYQASVSYQVQVVLIDSEEPPQVSPVVMQRQVTHSQIVSPGE